MTIEKINCKILYNLDTGQCAPQKEIDEILDSFRVTSFMSDSYINIDDVYLPNQPNARVESYEMTNYKGCNKLYIFLQQSSTNSDTGFIFTLNTKSSYIKIKSLIPDDSLNTLDLLGYNIIYEIIISADHTNTLTYIRYPKIQESIAGVGGIISIFRLTVLFLYRYLNYHKSLFKLFMKTYIKDEEIHRYFQAEGNLKPREIPEKTEDLRKTIQFKKYQTRIDLHNQKDLDTKNLENKQRKEIDLLPLSTYTLESNENKERKEIELLPLFKENFCCKKAIKENIYKLLTSKISKEMDICHYLCLIEDVNLMKNLIFDENEINIFNCFHDIRKILNAINRSDENISKELIKQNHLRGNKLDNSLSKYYIDSFCTDKEIEKRKLRKLDVSLFSKIKSKFNSIRQERAKRYES